MRSNLLSLSALFVALLFPALVNADISELMVGTSGPFDAFEDDANAAEFGQFFVFSLDATTDIDIDFNRTTADPDLYAVLFSGDITGSNPNDLSPDGLINGFTFPDPGDVFGPLTVISDEDDTEDDPFGGPFGDPRFTNTLDAGDYTVLVMALNVDGGQFTVTSNVGAVPEPSSIALIGVLGVCCLISRRRQR